MGLEGRFKYYGRYIFVIRCDVEWHMLYGLWPGWTTECEVVQNGVVKKSVWCETVT